MQNPNDPTADISVLQNIVLDGIDLYVDEPITFRPLVWNAKKNRWDDHPQAVQRELRMSREATMKVKSKSSRFWTLLGLASDANTSSSTSQTSASRPTPINARSNAQSTSSRTSNNPTGHGNHGLPFQISWGTVFIPALSGVGSFFLALLYKSMKYYEGSATDTRKWCLQKGVYFMEKVLPPLRFSIQILSS